MIRSTIQYPGPLGLDATVVSGTTISDAVIKAPLGPEFQAITGLTNNAAVDLATFVNTDQVIFGPRGGFVYAAAVSAEKKALAEVYLGVVSIPLEMPDTLEMTDTLEMII